MTFELEGKPKTRRFRLHDALRRTGSLLGDDDSCREWISESRCNFADRPVTLPRQRSQLLVTQLDRSRRNNPHPRHTTLFRARHGQREVCEVQTLLPDLTTPVSTEKSAYNIEFPNRSSLMDRVLIKHKPVIASGILPSFQVSPYRDVREELLLPAQVSEKFPSTKDTKKYIPRRRRTDDTNNQHYGDVPYGKEGTYISPLSYSRHFVTTEGRPLATKRHVSAPSDSLPVSGFDGGAAKTDDNTLHQRMLPYLKVPRII
ncbi:hypothetical protein BaRGS_00039140 [Batillaria attramentaria]|uniref:Uncharacterized protein n=1 Tax=Batillaria attramentaria TaxID=370345 RepID=A0ABD0J3W5_9CAEN